MVQLEQISWYPRHNFEKRIHLDKRKEKEKNPKLCVVTSPHFILALTPPSKKKTSMQTSE